MFAMIAQRGQLCIGGELELELELELEVELESEVEVECSGDDLLSLSGGVYDVKRHCPALRFGMASLVLGECGGRGRWVAWR
jgi:hypothetical protein